MARYPRSLTALLAVAATVLAACGGGGNQTASTKKVVVGFANIAEGDPTLTAMREVIVALGKKRGWDVITLNNDVNGPKAVENAQTMITQGVTYAIEFQADSSVMPNLMQKFNNAKVPVVAYDIPAPGAYFLGAPNAKSGEQAGAALGNYAKQNWNCQPDLVMLLDAPIASKIVSDLRVGGVQTGLLKVCPNIDKSLIIRRDGGGTTNTALPVARDILTAHPAAKKILISGMNDVSVVGGINAAEQLGRADQLYAWGQDGGVLTGGKANPHLAGSVLYFLEGYGIYTYKLLDEIHAGHAPKIGDSPDSTNAILVDSCAITAAQAAQIPPVAQRSQQLISGGGKTAVSMYCPKT